MGMDQSLSLLNRPARERVEALEKYPKMDAAPPALIFELILNLAEAGDFERATELFHNRFFPREESGTMSAKCGIEVQLLRALALAKEGHWGEALIVARNLGSEVPGLAFTRDGLEPFFNPQEPATCWDRICRCGLTVEAKAKFELASAVSVPTRSSGPGWQLGNCLALISAMARPPASFSGAGGKSEQYQFYRAGGNTRPHPWQRNSAKPRKQTLDFEGVVAAGPNAGISHDASGQVRSYAVITSIFALRRAR